MEIMKRTEQINSFFHKINLAKRNYLLFAAVQQNSASNIFCGVLAQLGSEPDFGEKKDLTLVRLCFENSKICHET